MVNPHGKRIEFGKHKGELFTRVPVSYLRWMINSGPEIPQYEIAKAEFERRGDTMPLVELSGHAIDNASLRVLDAWCATRETDSEGLYSWLCRMTLAAIQHGDEIDGKIHYMGMKFVVAPGDEFPTLKTIMTI